MKIKKFHKVEKCYLCGKSQFKDLGQSKCPILTSKNHLVKCENCGLVFVNPMPDEEELSKIYSTEYRLGYQSWIGKILNFYNNAVFAAEARFIKRYIKRGKIIDIGYGSRGGTNTVLMRIRKTRTGSKSKGDWELKHLRPWGD